MPVLYDDSAMTTLSPAGLARLTGEIHDHGSSALLPAWVRITDEHGAIVEDAGVHDSLRGFPCNGSFAVAVAPGRYEIAVHRHISHEWFVQTVTLGASGNLALKIDLKPWVNVAAAGFFCGESHDHLNYPQDPKAVVRYCEALGLSYLDLCQGWMHRREKDRITTGDEMARMLESHSTPTFHMYFGGERPKKRYGHVWWTNLTPYKDPFGEYMGWHDPDYVDFCRVPSNTDEVDIQPNCPLKGEVPFATWRRFQKQGGVCVSAHPTSWWMDQPDQKLITTNIACDMIYGLLAGAPSDAIVAMGYDPDQIFYQNVWFRLLNEGYRLAACAETDGNLTGSHHIGQILGYTQSADRVYSRAGVAEGMRTGRTLMTSGPFILFTADGGRYRMGDEITIEQPGHLLEIEAWSDPNPAEFLSGLVVYRNGSLFHTVDLRSTKPRHHRLVLPVSESGARAWYVVKAYGSQFPSEARFLDVFAYAALCEEEIHIEYQEIKQVALTNPIYFIPKGWTPPRPVSCRLHLETAPGAQVVISELGEPLATLKADDHGRLETLVSPLAELTITAPRARPVHRSLFLDYGPVRHLVEYCYTGHWRAHTRSGMRPGQVPWKGFAFEALRDALQDIHWCIIPDTDKQESVT